MKRVSIVVFLIISLTCSAQTGIDVSNHQGQIDWDLVAKDAHDIKFVYIKASEGATYKDKRFKYNMTHAKASGLLAGAYHYFRMTSGAHKQFANFKVQLDACEFDLIPMVDVETLDGKPVVELQDSLAVFIKLIKDEYSASPMIFGTNRSYNTYCAPRFNNLFLYIGRYGKSKPVINGPGRYTIWQYSETGRIKGIDKNVDLCKFRDKKDFEKIQNHGRDR